jgi:hypothetical protein
MFVTTMFMSQPLWRDIKVLAAERDQSAASIVRLALSQFLEREAAKSARRATKRRK